MKNQIEMVRKFNSTFKKFTGNPVLPSLNVPESVVTLRKKLIEEETREVFEAIQDGDLVNLSKEVSDLLYVVFGLCTEFGLDSIMEDAFELVQNSNMSKLDDSGNPILREDGKIIKGPNYKEPDMSVLFNS